MDQATTQQDQFLLQLFALEKIKFDFQFLA
jgi:hypothetical protein